MIPEIDLVFATLNRAILDLFAEGTGSSDAARRATRLEALRFLTATHGDWAKSRATFCEMVGIDPDEMRRRCVRALEGDTTALEHYPLTHIDEARALWAEVNRPTPLRAPKPKADTLDDLLALTASKPAPTPAPQPTVVHERHEARTRKVCAMIEQGLNTVAKMANAEGVHENTMRDWVTYALHQKRVERVGQGKYRVVPQTEVEQPRNAAECVSAG